MTKKISYALIVAACLIAPMLVAYATAPFGIGISEDSVAYITMAQGIVRGIGPVSFDGSPIPDWPPLYPFLIAVIKQLFPVAYDEAARLLNIVLYPAAIGLSAALIKHYTGSLAMAALGAISTAVYFPVFDMALYAFSELPFITLSLCLLAAINRYTEQPSMARLIVAALIAALLCLTRYTGMAVVGIVALFLIIFHWRRRDALLKIGLSIALYAVVALLPLGLWAARNFALTGMPFGPRPPALATLELSLAQTVGTLVGWLLTLYGYQNILFAAIMMLLLAAVAVLVRVHWRAFRRRLAAQPEGLLLTALLSVLYTAFMIVSSVTTAFSALNQRLLSPSAMPLLIFLLCSGYILFKVIPKKRKLIAYVLPLTAIFWIALNALSLADGVGIVRAQGLYFNSVEWRKSALIAYVKDSPSFDDATIYANKQSLLYFFLERPVYGTPSRTFFNSPQIASELNDDWLLDENGYVVWFSKWLDRQLYTLEELKTTAHFTLIASFDDGSIYHVRKHVANDD